MKKITSFMLTLLVAMTAMAQKALLVSEGLLATQENGQYKWTSEKMTMPEGASKLRVTFLQTSNNEKPAGFPCVAIAEFYLYDKDGNVVTLTEANFSSNATQGNEGKMSSICDGFTTQQDGQGAYDWYWHSQWSGDPAPYGHHYLEIDLTNVTADLSEYNIGWVTRRSQGSPAEVVISTGATTEEAAQNFDTAYLTSLLTSNEEAPVYFTIRNIRNGDYCASYTRNNMNLALGSTKTKASIFYFTGAVEDGLATVKIHNYAADGVCMADFGSWTEEGINWYVQLSGNTDKRGYAISKENNLTTKISWNNDANNNNKVSAWDGNDIGSTFVFVKLSAAEVQNIVNEFISGPDKLISGTSYRFRSLSGYKYIAGGDVNAGTNNIAGDNTAFAYYVSSNTGAKYLYNISSKKFIGTTSTGNADIPLSATVTSGELTFKSSTNAIYPIMFSTNNGGGSVNYSGWYGKLINWQGGFGDTGSADNSFSAEKVEVIDQETLATIETLVKEYESQFDITAGYYTIKCGDKYVSDDRKGDKETQRILTTGGATAKNIFYYDGSKALMGYSTGYGFVYACCNTKNPKDGMNHFEFKYDFSRKGYLVKSSAGSSTNGWADGFWKANDGNYLERVGENAASIWTLEEVTTLPVTISAAKHATFYAPVAVTIPAGVTAHTVTINEGGWADLHIIEGGVIPANTGVVLYSETAGTYNLTITEDVEAIANNALRGSVATTYYTEAGTYYALALVGGEVGFYKDAFNNDRFQNNSHKAYLYVENTNPAALSTSLRFEFAGTTAIEEVETEAAETVIYDLTGRRVNEITKAGVYIINGKKILVK